MSKNIIRTVIMITVVVFIVPALLTNCNTPATPKSFQRITKKDLPKNQCICKLPLQLKAKKLNSGKAKGDKLTTGALKKGCLLGVEQKTTIEITPKILGKTGFQTYLHLTSMEKRKNIRFFLDIKKKNGTIKKVGRTSKTKRPVSFLRTMEIEKGDVLRMTFRGNGIAYFTHPIIYRIKEPNQRENIILIGIDTFRADQIGVKVNGRSITPNIDAFIGDSVCFDRACSQTSWTLPSFMSLFTGLYEYNHEVGIKNNLSAEKPFLVEPLSKKFITFAFHGGKVMKSRWGFSRGFDYYSHYRFAGSLFKRGGQALFNRAFKLLEQGRFPNLFLFLHTFQVHAPYTPPLEFLHQLHPAPVYTELQAVNLHKPAKTYIPVEDEVKRRAYKELYQAEIFAFDAYFGEFITKLKKAGLYDNAMIVFVSDHGEEFFEHNGWTHAHALYDELIHVPMIMKFPGNRFKGKHIKDPVGVLDIMPTVMSHYGIEFERQKLDGRDLLPLIEGTGTRTPGYVVSSISTSRYFDQISAKIALNFDHYKIIYNYPYQNSELDFFREYHLPPETGLLELYNLEKDPLEMNNTAKSEAAVLKKIMPTLFNIKKKIDGKLTGAPKKKPLDKEVVEQLKSLGYL